MKVIVLILLAILTVVGFTASAFSKDDFDADFEGWDKNLTVTIYVGSCKGVFHGEKRDVEDYLADRSKPENQKRPNALADFAEKFTKEAFARGCVK